MIWVADSGATKTDWCLIGKTGKTERYITPGINPFHQDAEEIARTVARALPRRAARQVFFYGAGCSDPEGRKTVEKGLHNVSPEARLEVQSDIMGAARALCGNSEGIVCILGTGAASAYYNGEEVVRAAPSLGYILGDEGSGAWLGKRLIADYFNHESDEKSRQCFEDYGLCSKAYMLDRVYRKPRAAAFLASYAPLIRQNIDQPYFYRLVREGFRLFVGKLSAYYADYQSVPLYFTGSVAYVYRAVLREAVAPSGFRIQHIVKKPIPGLISFHRAGDN